MRLVSVGLAVAGLTVASISHAGERMPSPFVAKDEWVFKQVREVPGRKQEVNPEIRFSILKLNTNWVGWARAITDDKKVIWQPMWELPQSRCVQDFVGKSDLGIADSCGKPLEIGGKWEYERLEAGETIASKYVVEAEEEVQVAAGRFASYRIAETADIYEGAAGARRLTLKRRSTYWFAPDAKAFIRTDEEYFTPKGEKFLRLKSDLVQLKLVHAAGQPGTP